MATLAKVSNTEYEITGLGAVTDINVYFVEEDDYELSLIATVQNTTTSGDFESSGFSFAFNRGSGGNPDVITLTSEGLFVLEVVDTGEMYFMWNYTTVQKCMLAIVDDLLCSKGCGINWYKMFTIMLSGTFVFTLLESLLNVRIDPYTPGITQVENIELIFTLLGLNTGKLTLYCSDCESKINCRC